MPSLGVDFGTSNTVAVVRSDDGRSRTLLVDGSPLLPSAVYAEPGGGLVVGRDAVYSARLDPARFEPNPKRRIDDGTVLLGDRELPIVDLVAAVLGRVCEEWTRTVGSASPEVTLTCPAVWGSARRSVLTAAAAQAGLGAVKLVVEPVAAATYFAQELGREVPIGSVVVVHDFGAGTFDASVVARTSSGFEVLAVDGRDDIGGIDIDAALIEYLQKTYAERCPDAWTRLTAPTTVEERRAKRQLWDDVRATKERLSRHATADLLIPLADLEVHLTRPELEVLAEPILAQTVRVTEGLLRWANLAEGRIAGVFLVGGASRIPLLSTLLFRALGEAPVVIEQPELVVAEGSILAGAVTVGVEAPAAPGPTTGLQPRIPADAWGTAGPPSLSFSLTPPVSEAPSVAAGPSVSAAPVFETPSGQVDSPAPVSPVPAPVPAVGRVAVPGARPPGRARVTPTLPVPVEESPPPRPVEQPPVRRAPVRPAPVGRPAKRPPRRGRVRRFFAILFIVLLLIAVPVVAGVVAYGLARGEGFVPDRIESELRDYHLTLSSPIR